MQRALYDAETIVAEVERLVTEVEGEARAKDFSISSDGTVSDVSDPPTFPNRYEADEWSRIRQQTAQALADDVSTILGRAAAADATIAGGVPRATWTPSTTTASPTRRSPSGGPR